MELRDHHTGKLVIKDHFFLFLAFFALGLNEFIIYLPFFALYFFLKGARLWEVSLARHYLILASLMLLATVPLYIFGYYRMEVESPLRSMMPTLFSILAAGFALQYQSRNTQYKLITLYVIGIGIEAIIIAVYSYLLDSNRYGYGRLFNPFSWEEINSPSTSNNLAVFATLVLYQLIVGTGLLRKAFLMAFLVVTLMVAFFLGGRTFFVVLIFGVFFIMATHLSIKALFRFLLAASFIAVIALVIANAMEGMDRYFEFTIQRLTQGLESPRFLHYAHGLSELMYYPFGGFVIDVNIESTKWFHNVFLDNARLAGWFPALALLLVMAYIATSLINKKHEYFGFAFTFFMVAVLIMQQDVVVEGNYRTLMLMYFSGILLLNRRI